MAENFYRSFQLSETIVKPFNIYEPRQSVQADIPAIITQLRAGNMEIKLGELTPTQDFNYVKDTMQGFISIYESDKTIGEEINIASQKEISVGKIAQELIQQINPTARIICDVERLRSGNSEVSRLLGCDEKIRRFTDWKSQFSPEEGLQNTIEFLRNYFDKYKVDI